MTPDENKAAIRRWFEEGLNHGLDAARAMAGDYLSDPQAAEPDMIYIYTAFPDSQYTIEDMVAEGDKLVVRWTSRGTHRGGSAGCLRQDAG
jgi:predicted ester cyclase